MSNGEIILYTSEDGTTSIQLKAYEETVWLTQMELADLFQTTKQNISLHIKNIFLTKELPESVVKDNLTTAADGKRERFKRSMQLTAKICVPIPNQIQCFTYYCNARRLY